MGVIEISLVKFDVKNYIAVLTLNRPEAANALSKALQDELNEKVSAIKTDPSIRCVVITGAGEKVFCAGADLKERRGMNETQVIEAVQFIGQTVSNIASLEVPVIAAINGAAFGGGLELALACDIRIAAAHAKMGLTETSLAIIPGAGGTQRLPRLIGLGQAKRMIYAAERKTAEQALKMGLVESVPPADELMNTVMELAEQIAHNGPIAVRQAKKAIDVGIESDLTTGLQFENLAYQQTIPTEDRVEGLVAFKEKENLNTKEISIRGMGSCHISMT
ncbi:Enoyl-CoA hydratase [Lentibacillus sp. JNUCC-1]|nr:Enoyl-CoA hydratase [Lentibacillus sp. JNUCC-1]